jgi:hypothetical protein
MKNAPAEINSAGAFYLLTRLIGRLFNFGLLSRIFFVQQLIDLQTAATAKVQSLAVEFLCDRVLCISVCAAMIAFDCVYHSITCPYENEGMTLATASPRRTV